jgi:hypothetical protein
MFSYKLTDDLSVRNIKNNHFVFDRKTGIVHTFNGTGTFLWKQISVNTPFTDIIKNLTDEFEIAEETAKIDAYSFIIELQNKHLLEILDT